MTLPAWLVPGVFVFVSLAVVLGAKRYWVKGLGLLFGLIFLQDFLLQFTRDITALLISVFIAIVASVLLIMRKRRKTKKKEEESQRGGTTINIGSNAYPPGRGRHRP